MTATVNLASLFLAVFTASYQTASVPALDDEAVTITLRDNADQPVVAGDGWVDVRSSWDSPANISKRLEIKEGVFVLPKRGRVRLHAARASMNGHPVYLDGEQALVGGVTLSGILVTPLLVRVVDADTGADLTGVHLVDAPLDLFGSTPLGYESIETRQVRHDSPFEVRMAGEEDRWVYNENIQVSVAGYATEYVKLRHGQPEQTIRLSIRSRLEIHVKGLERAPTASSQVLNALNERAQARVVPHVAIYRIVEKNEHHSRVVAAFDQALSGVEPEFLKGLPADRTEAFKHDLRLVFAKRIQEELMGPRELELDANGMAAAEDLPAGRLLVTLEQKAPPTQEEQEHIPSRYFWNMMGGGILDCAFVVLKAGESRSVQLEYPLPVTKKGTLTIRAVDAATKTPIHLGRFKASFHTLLQFDGPPVAPVLDEMSASFSHTCGFGWLYLSSFEAPWYVPFDSAHELVQGSSELVVALERATGVVVRWLDNGEPLNLYEGLDEDQSALFKVQLVPANGGTPLRVSLGPDCTFFTVPKDGQKEGVYHLKFPDEPPFEGREDVELNLKAGSVIERTEDLTGE